MGIQGQIKVTQATYDHVEKMIESIEDEIETIEEGIKDRRNNQSPEEVASTNENEKLLRSKQRLNELETNFNKFKVVPTPKSNGKVEFGHTITVSCDGNKSTFRLEELRSGVRGVCNINSRMGQKLLGTKVGDSFYNDVHLIKVLKIV